MFTKQNTGKEFMDIKKSKGISCLRLDSSLSIYLYNKAWSLAKFILYKPAMKKHMSRKLLILLKLK